MLTKRTVLYALALASLILGGVWTIGQIYEGWKNHLDATVPFPLPGHSVTLDAKIPIESKYSLHILATAPPSARELVDDRIVCPIQIQVGSARKAEITKLRQYAKGAEHEVYTIDFDWNLPPGFVTFDIWVGESCSDERFRGATISLVERVDHLKEKVIVSQLKFLAGLILLAYGGRMLIRLTRARR
ncbi:MAG: hypothetical protein AB1400_05415 [Pseudomonadota bacterium]